MGHEQQQPPSGPRAQPPDRRHTDLTVFNEALALPTPEQRSAYLAEACAGDADRHDRVRRLLEAHAHADAGAFLHGPPPGVAPVASAGDGSTGTRVAITSLGSRWTNARSPLGMIKSSSVPASYVSP